MTHVTYEPHGLPATGTEVLMSSFDARPTTSHGSEALYTRSMGDCIGIATFDHGNHDERTMTHLLGRAAAVSYYQALANRISPNTTVIVACGSIGSRFYFENIDLGNIRALLEGQMRLLNKAVDHLEWLSLYTEENAQGLVAGTLVLQADGKYGRIRQ